MPLTNQEKQQALRKRRAGAGLKELRNVWISEEEEKELRARINEILENMRSQLK